MAEVSVKQLATDIDTPVDRLLQQFVDAGTVSKSKADDLVSESEKQTPCWAHLKKQHGGDEVAAPARMTFAAAKTKSTLSVQGYWWQEQGSAG